MPPEIAPPALKYWSVKDLIDLRSDQDGWIIPNLLKKGAQVLLAGPPKSGKTLIASQIALALAQPFGDDVRYLFPPANGDADAKGIRLSPPEGTTSWNVLFVSLEMTEPAIGERLRSQLGLSDAAAANADSIRLTHIFGIPNQTTENGLGPIKQDLQIIRTDPTGRDTQPALGKPPPDFEDLRKAIETHKPDVVIVDSLVQLHGGNENDNIIMKHVMRTVRKVVGDTAHIIIHHARKESPQSRSGPSATMMRGASAIHGVADLVITIFPKNNGEYLAVNVSSRYSEVSPFFLRRVRETLTYEVISDPDTKGIKPGSPKEEIRRRIALEILRNGPLPAKALLGEMARKLQEDPEARKKGCTSISMPTLRDHLKTWTRDGSPIKSSKKTKGKGCEYSLP